MRTAAVFFVFLFVLSTSLVQEPTQGKDRKNLFARENLVAWCIVPFDGKKRGPEERAAMLARLGFKHFAYDWRAEHIKTFDAEIAALQKHGIQLDAFWFPAGLNNDARAILDCLKRHNINTQLWVTFGDPAPGAKDQAAKIEAAARILRPIADEAANIGCSVGLYNHGGWFGEPENQIAVLEHLKLKNVGIVYNFHHGHDHLDRFPALLKKMQPHLYALNLNGMVKNGAKLGKKILPLGQGDLDLGLLKTIRASGYSGPIGILGHTQDDAEARLRDNLDGLDWLVPQLDGKAPGPKPKPRTLQTSAAPTQIGAVGWLAEGKPHFRGPNLTVELRAKLNGRANYNILVASDTKQSGAHWEIFTMTGSGNLAVHMPGMTPDHLRTGVNICDGQWHDIAMYYAPHFVSLYCDDVRVAYQPITSKEKATVPGGLAFARLVEGTLGCNGTLDFVRLTRGLRIQKMPKDPVADEETIGLWRFTKLGVTAVDESKFKNHAKAVGVTDVAKDTGAPPGD